MEINQTPNQVPTPPTPAPVLTPPPTGSSSNTGMAILAYLGILVIVPLISEAKNDPFVKFHAKQGLALVVAVIISWVLAIIPILGWILFPIVMVGWVILSIIGIMNAANNQMKELPIIGSFGNKFNF